MMRSLLAALLFLAPPSFAQVVSVKTTIPSLTAAPAAGIYSAPAINPSISAPALSLGLTPALAPTIAPALVPALSAPAALVPSALAVKPALAPAIQPAAPLASLKGAVANFGEKLAGAPKALLQLFDGAASAGDVAGPVSAAGAPVRSLESIKRLKVGSYNVENLFEQVGSHVPDPENPGKLKKVSDAKPKPDWAMAEEGKIILEQDLDIVTLAEVEDIQALNDFNERFLGGKYKAFLIEGNDERGIDIAFLVKKDLPFDVEQRSHKEETWVDPILGGGPRPLFSRDLTSLVVRAPGQSKPLFVLFGTHYKSKRDRDPRDPESNIVRAAQVERTAEIMKRYEVEFGADVPMMLAGDFNGSVPTEDAYKPLFAKAGLTDSFDASPNPPSDKDRITHTFHPRGGPSHYAQMDAVLVSKGLRGAVQSAEVYRYKNADGTARDIPRTYEEREKNPSDHFPLIVTLDFAPIRERFVPEWKPGVKPAPKPDEGLVEFAYEHLKAADAPLRERVLALAKAYLSAEKPERQAAYLLSTAYYDGLETLERMGMKIPEETRRQTDGMLAVLDSITPRAKARRHQEPEINRAVNTFEGLLYSFDRRGLPPPPPPAVRSPAQDARDFADSAKSWLASTGPAFDAKIAEWKAWTANPGKVNAYTTRNLPAIRARIEALEKAKAAFARAALSVPPGATTPEGVRALYDAWDALRSSANDSMIIVADSFDTDLSKRGLMANLDQNTNRHPGGFEVFLSAGLTVDWDGARALNDALRGAKTP